MTFGFHVGSENFWKLFFCFPRSPGFARIWFNPSRCQVLYRDSVSVIVSWFTSFTKWIFCPRCGCASASSARSPCHFGLHADVAISVLREASTNTVLTPIALFSAALKLTHEKNSRVRPCVLELLRPQDFLWILLTIFGRSRNKSHRTGSVSSFLFVFFGFYWFWRHVSPRAWLLILSLRVVSGRNVETTESCGNDAWNVCVAELEEPVDEPGTTIGTQFSVLHCIRLPSSIRCGFWPLVHSYEYPWSSQNFQSERTAGVSSRSFTVTNKSNSLTYTVASKFVCTSPLAATTVVGLLETLRITIRLSSDLSCSACALMPGIYNEFSFLQFYYGCCWETPNFGRWEKRCCRFLWASG